MPSRGRIATQNSNSKIKNQYSTKSNSIIKSYCDTNDIYHQEKAANCKNLIKIQHKIDTKSRYNCKKLTSKHLDNSIGKHVIKMMQFSIQLVLLLAINAKPTTTLGASPSSGSTIAQASSSELVALGGQVGQSVRLPCLIGRQFNCGEPYFIAWYKLNVIKPSSWTRIEYVTGQSSSSMTSDIVTESSSDFMTANSYANSNNQSNSNRFTFFRGHTSSSGLTTCDSLLSNSMQQQFPNSKRLATNSFSDFECAQLEISQLELHDEGQYKCEITFSESLEVDKCPPSSVTRLTVIGKLTLHYYSHITCNFILTRPFFIKKKSIEQWFFLGKKYFFLCKIFLLRAI